MVDGLNDTDDLFRQMRGEHFNADMDLLQNADGHADQAEPDEHERCDLLRPREALLEDIAQHDIAEYDDRQYNHADHGKPFQCLEQTAECLP